MAPRPTEADRAAGKEQIPAGGAAKPTRQHARGTAADGTPAAVASPPRVLAGVPRQHRHARARAPRVALARTAAAGRQARSARQRRRPRLRAEVRALMAYTGTRYRLAQGGQDRLPLREPGAAATEPAQPCRRSPIATVLPGPDQTPLAKASGGGSPAEASLAPVLPRVCKRYGARRRPRPLTARTCRDLNSVRR